MKYIILLFIFSGFVARAHKQPAPTNIDQQAVEHAQSVMRNPSERNEALRDNKNAQGTDKMVKDLMGEDSDEMYNAAADFMPYIVKMGEGDPAKMNVFMQNALRDPASFEKNLPPDLRNKITELSKKVKNPPPSPANSGNGTQAKP